MNGLQSPSSSAEADLLWSIRVLGVDDPATWRKMASLLGLSVQPPDALSRETPTVQEAKTQKAEEPGTPAPLPPPPPAPKKPSPPTPRPPSPARELAWRRVPLDLSAEGAQGDLGQRLAQAKFISFERFQHFHETGDPPPLFGNRKKEKNLWSVLLETRLAEGEVDVAALHEQMVRLQPIVHLPRRTHPTLRHGVRLWVEEDWENRFLNRDLKYLLTILPHILGAASVETVLFRITSGFSFDVRPPLLPGQPVVAISCLGRKGYHRPATSHYFRQWVRMARRLRQTDNPLTILTPHPPTMAPLALRQVAQVVQWDRRTRVSQVITGKRSPLPGGGA